jgi:hypothetical protein
MLQILKAQHNLADMLASVHAGMGPGHILNGKG